jgi:hypothetical protein
MVFNAENWLPLRNKGDSGNQQIMFSLTKATLALVYEQYDSCQYLDI